MSVKIMRKKGGDPFFFKYLFLKERIYQEVILKSLLKLQYLCIKSHFLTGNFRAIWNLLAFWTASWIESRSYPLLGMCIFIQKCWSMPSERRIIQNLTRTSHWCKISRIRLCIHVMPMSWWQQPLNLCDSMQNKRVPQVRRWTYPSESVLRIWPEVHWAMLKRQSFENMMS